jgi:hypothetical protein
MCSHPRTRVRGFVLLRGWRVEQRKQNEVKGLEDTTEEHPVREMLLLELCRAFICSR